MDRPNGTPDRRSKRTMIGPGGAEFYIPATSSVLERRQETLKRDDTFALFDARGDFVPLAGGSDGLYHKDTRFLSRLEFFLDEHQPIVLSSTVQDDNSALNVDLVNPDLYKDKQLVLSREMLHITRTICLWRGACYQRLALKNFAMREHTLRLMFAYGADFVDLFEVRGLKRRRRGTLTVRSQTSRSSPLPLSAGSTISSGSPRSPFAPAPLAHHRHAIAGFEFDARAPHTQHVLCVSVRAGHVVHEPDRPFDTMLRRAARGAAQHRLAASPGSKPRTNS